MMMWWATYEDLNTTEARLQAKLLAIGSQLRRVETQLELIVALMKEEEHMLQDLKDEVAQVRTVEESAIQLIGRLADLVEEHMSDPAELAKIVTELRASRAALAAAVLANTPASDLPNPPLEE